MESRCETQPYVWKTRPGAHSSPSSCEGRGSRLPHSWDLGLHCFLEFGAAFSLHQVGQDTVDAGQAPFAFGTKPIEHPRPFSRREKMKIATGRCPRRAVFARWGGRVKPRETIHRVPHFLVGPARLNSRKSKIPGGAGGLQLPENESERTRPPGLGLCPLSSDISSI